MTCGFKDRFVIFVHEGSKRHTIRDGKRWKVGDRLDAFQNVRQMNQTLILRAPVTRVEDITIHHTHKNWQNCTLETSVAMQCPMCRETVLPEHGRHSCSQGPLIVMIDGNRLADSEVNEFFFRDGFRDEGVERAQFFAYMFWRDQLRNGPFEGQVIHWDYDRRTFEPTKKTKPRKLTKPAREA